MSEDERFALDYGDDFGDDDHNSSRINPDDEYDCMDYFGGNGGGETTSLLDSSGKQSNNHTYSAT
jgi:hypothetical protein